MCKFFLVGKLDEEWGKMEGELKIKGGKEDREKLVIIGSVGNECRVDEARCAKIPPGTWAAVLITGGLIILYYKDTFTVYK